MKKSLKAVSEPIDSLASKTVLLDPADMTGFGEALRGLENLEDSCGDGPEAAGGAILGDGTVSLIWDVAGVLDLAVQESPWI